MKRVLSLLLLATLCVGRLAHAGDVLTIEITKGVQGATPIAIVPFGADGAAPPQDVAKVVRDDLKRSGMFNTIQPDAMPARPQTSAEVNFDMWKFANQQYLVVGQVQPGSGGYTVRFQLLDVYSGQQLLGFNVPSSERDLRRTAHHIADLIYEKLTGQPGAFATQIAFITTIREGGVKKIALMIADADGYGEQTIVTSTEPLMSPAWSPDGQRLAYVSFEDGPPGIYVQEVYTGRRQRVTSFPGINGAPAWSPDGSRLAVTLSKDGNPEIYVMSASGGGLLRLTNQSAIDTEPSWSPDGRHIIFTSDRGGGPQIYRVSASGGSPERLTFEGSYNARASYSPDGKSLVLVTRQGGDFSIGLLDVGSKRMQVLTGGVLDESPSFTANGAMVIYGTKVGGRGELAAVSVDGRVRQRLAVRAGDVREPSCSPNSRTNTR